MEQLEQHHEIPMPAKEEAAFDEALTGDGWDVAAVSVATSPIPPGDPRRIEEPPAPLPDAPPPADPEPIPPGDPSPEEPPRKDPIPDPLSAAVEDARTLAREQVAAAWQVHLDRVREQLDAGWRDSLDHIWTERFGDVERSLRSGYEAAVSGRAAAASHAATSARSETVAKLNNLARRLRSAESPEEARHALLDAAGEYGTRVALFDASTLDLGSAPALASALESKDTVVSAVAASELSSPVADHFTGSSRVLIVPVVANGSAVALLCAAVPGGPVDASAMELLAALAAPHLKDAAASQPESHSTAPAVRPGWSDLTRPEQDIHLRAQRFARTRVAELLLNQISRVRDARQSKTLYQSFQAEIDAAREAFRREFLEHCSTMVDYLHLELVRTLAKDDAESLGARYPGPLSL